MKRYSKNINVLNDTFKFSAIPYRLQTILYYKLLKIIANYIILQTILETILYYIQYNISILIIQKIVTSSDISWKYL